MKLLVIIYITKSHYYVTGSMHHLPCLFAVGNRVCNYTLYTHSSTPAILTYMGCRGLMIYHNGVNTIDIIHGTG